MRKIIALLLTFSLILCFTGCAFIDNKKEEPTSATAKIVTNDAKTVKMTAKELIELYGDDPDEFEENYVGAKITVSGTIAMRFVSCNNSTNTNDIDIYSFYDDDWNLSLGCDADEFESGDEVKFTTKIISCGDSSVFLGNIDDFGNDHTEIELN